MNGDRKIKRTEYYPMDVIFSPRLKALIEDEGLDKAQVLRQELLAIDPSSANRKKPKPQPVATPPSLPLSSYAWNNGQVAGKEYYEPSPNTL
jgi:hypothetical protein